MTFCKWSWPVNDDCLGFGGEKSVDNVLLTFFISCFCVHVGGTSQQRHILQAVLTVVLSAASQFLTLAGTRAQCSGSYASPRIKVQIFSTTFNVTQLWEGRGSGIPGACRPAVLPNYWSSGSVGEPVSKKGQCVWIKGMIKIRRMRDKKEEGRGEKKNVLNTLYVLVRTPTPWTRNVCSVDKEKESGLGLALKVGEWWKTSDTPVPYIQTCAQRIPPSMHIYTCSYHAVPYVKFLTASQ